LFHQHGHGLTHLGGVVDDVNASLFKSADFIKSTALATGDDGTSVTHSSAWRSGLTSNEGDNWEVAMIVLWEPISSLFLGLTTDFTDHNNTMSLWVLNKSLKNIDEVGAIERITTNTDNSWLTKSNAASLVNSLVSQGAWTRHDTDVTWGVNVTWHDTNLAFTWLDDTWAIGSDEAGLVLALKHGFNSNHIESGDTFSDANDKLNFWLDSLLNGISGEWSWDIDNWGLSTSVFLGLTNCSEYGEV
jgi:hypothetical protein